MKQDTLSRVSQDNSFFCDTIKHKQEVCVEENMNGKKNIVLANQF